MFVGESFLEVDAVFAPQNTSSGGLESVLCGISPQPCPCWDLVEWLNLRKNSTLRGEVAEFSAEKQLSIVLNPALSPGSCVASSLFSFFTCENGGTACLRRLDENRGRPVALGTAQDRHSL